MWIQCGIHPREWITHATCLYIIDRLLDENDGRELLSSLDFYIVPVVNPDGYEYTWTYEHKPICTKCFGSVEDFKACKEEVWDDCKEEFFTRLWRKNRRPFKVSSKARATSDLDDFRQALNRLSLCVDNDLLSTDCIENVTSSTFARQGTEETCYGVDLNRNFDVGFGAGSSDDPCHPQIYRGPEPFSELETSTVRDMILGIQTTQPVVSFLDIHSCSQLVLVPYGLKNMTSPHHVDLSNIADELAGSINQVHGANFTAKLAASLYEQGGIAEDWAHKKVYITGLIIKKTVFRYLQT